MGCPLAADDALSVVAAFCNCDAFELPVKIPEPTVAYCVVEQVWLLPMWQFAGLCTSDSS